MLFNSYIFLFLFFPLTLYGFYLLGKLKEKKPVIVWLIVMSLVFYGWWNPRYLFIILFSVTFNYFLGKELGKRKKKTLLYFGIFANLVLLFYFKYFNFFIDTIRTIFPLHISNAQIILPLAISFFTFQQIAYLVDAYYAETSEYDIWNYSLFVLFFPQLIAGPIVHHKQIIPQFANPDVFKPKSYNLSVGLSILALGLFKKVVLADNISEYATPIFQAAENLNTRLTFFESWSGALAYSLQLYFDFSGYSDMAIGLSKMFNIKLPINFFSPYKSKSIIEFWQRWHITLSGFLRDYIYIPLGGNRMGSGRRYINLMITMILGGMWHGAGWTFILWGFIHGIFLSVNHLWRQYKPKYFQNSNFFYSKISHCFTFILIVLAWVLFRAETVSGAKQMYSGMFGMNGISLPESFNMKFSQILPANLFVYEGMFKNGYFKNPGIGVCWLFFSMLVIFLLPNTVEFFRKFKPVLNTSIVKEKNPGRLLWIPNLGYFFVFVFISLVSTLLLQKESEFLYFQF